MSYLVFCSFPLRVAQRLRALRGEILFFSFLFFESEINNFAYKVSVWNVYDCGCDIPAAPFLIVV
jgi:hypothetical protein